MQHSQITLFNAPWAKMTAAAKQGNPDRLVSYNRWILPKVNDFYEVFVGENDFNAKMVSDSFPWAELESSRVAHSQGCQGQITKIVDGVWGHFKVNTPISPPRYSPDTMIAKIRDAISRRNVPTFVCQDGRISPETLALFKEIRHAIRPTKGE